MALPKIHNAVDAEISKVLARGRDSFISLYGRSPRLTFDDKNLVGGSHFFHLDNIDWPPTVLEFLESMQSHSQMGYFPDLKKMWVMVDNKIMLWNPFAGKDISVFNGVSQLIVSVSDPVRPKPGVFKDCISRIFAIASCDVVSLIGVQQRTNVGGECETRLVDLEFAAAAPCMIIKFVSDPNTGNFFAAGSDGNVYQVHYSRTASVLYPRMSLVAASSSGLFRSSYAFVVSTIKSSLGKKSSSPLVDICFDNRSQIVYCLNSANTVTGYQRSGASLSLSFKYTYEKGTSVGVSPLVAIHVGSSLNTLVAVSENGERILLKVSTDAWTSASSLVETGDTFPSPLPSEHLLSRSWYAEGVFVVSGVDTAVPKNSDSVTFVCDGVQGEPSVGYRASPSAGIYRIEHICEIEHPTFFPDSLQQVVSPPRLLLLIHRKGIFVYMRARPVENLHLILELPKDERERKLEQFVARCSSIELCAMLSQLASRLSHDTLLTQRFLMGEGSFAGNESLVRSLLIGPSSETSRLATDVLRRYCIPTIEEKLRGVTREIVVNFSPFAVGVLTYFSRILIPIWTLTPLLTNDNGLTVVNLETIKMTDMSVRRLIAFLEHSKGDLWHDSQLSNPTIGDVSWDRFSAKFDLAQTAMLTSSDCKAIQGSFISNLLEFSRSVSQVLSFFLVCGRFEKRVIDHFGKELGSSKEFSTDIKSTFGKFVMNIGDIRKVARFVARTVVQSSSYCPKEVALLFEEMERNCPVLFDAADRDEYATILQFSEILERSSVSESSIQQALSRAGNIAGGLYGNGTLLPLATKLQQLNMHREAISLYLYAASQLSGSLDDWERLSIVIIGTLERLYEFDRQAFNSIVGTPFSSGSLWYIRPHDSRTHLLILSWLGERRNDECLTDVLQRTLIRVPSVELEGFLCRNIHNLGLIYAEYLGCVKGDYHSAVEVCSRLLHDPLPHVAPCDRLSFRLKCSRKAVECAIEGGSAQRTGAEHTMEILLLQAKLLSVIQRFLTSGSKALEELVLDGTGRQQRDLASHHLLLVQSDILTQEKLFVLALNYEAIEEALEVAMEALQLNRTYDPMVISRLLQRVIRPERTMSEISRFVQRFGKRTGFPVVSLILLCEQWQFSRSPQGSSVVPKILIESGLEFDTIFNGYSDIIERRAVQLATALGIEGRLPESYLLFSIASLVQRADGRVGGVNRFAPVVRAMFERVARSASASEKNILKLVGDIIENI